MSQYTLGSRALAYLSDDNGFSNVVRYQAENKITAHYAKRSEGSYASPMIKNLTLTLANPPDGAEVDNTVLTLVVAFPSGASGSKSAAIKLFSNIIQAINKQS